MSSHQYVHAHVVLTWLDVIVSFSCVDFVESILAARSSLFSSTHNSYGVVAPAGVVVEGAWSGASAGGCPNNLATWRDGRQYELRVDRPSSLKIALRALGDVEPRPHVGM